MDLDRGLLARIDRRVLSGLDDEETYRMVGLSVSAATWSTWKQYCDAAGISMGRAIVALISHELGAVVGEAGPDDPVFGRRAFEQLAERQADLAGYKRSLDERAEQLRRRERRLRTLGQQIRSSPSDVVTGPRIESEGGPPASPQATAPLRGSGVYGLNGERLWEGRGGAPRIMGASCCCVATLLRRSPLDQW